MGQIRQNIITNEWVECLSRLRDARALILRDAEAFHEACTTLEKVGQTLCGQIRNGLNFYRGELLELTRSTGLQESSEVERLFDVVRDARNMAVHEGAWARHLSSRLVDLFIILEDSIITKMSRVEDIMVRNPVAAEHWQMVGQARQMMLANSFSHLPILQKGAWRIISDVSLMLFLRGATNATDLKGRLSTRLDDAIGGFGVTAVEADCCGPRDTLDLLPPLLEKGPVLVTEVIDDAPRLLGIITPFDLL